MDNESWALWQQLFNATVRADAAHRATWESVGYVLACNFAGQRVRQEREACAQLAESTETEGRTSGGYCFADGPKGKAIAELIRARKD